MNTPVTMKRIVEASPRFKAGITAVFYLFTMLMAALVLSVHGKWAVVIDLIASACYLAVTALFYDLFKPASRSFSTRRILQPRATDCKTPPRVHEEVRRTT
jgi:hypothetical protein